MKYLSYETRDDVVKINADQNEHGARGDGQTSFTWSYFYTSNVWKIREKVRGILSIRPVISCVLLAKNGGATGLSKVAVITASYN